MKKYFFPFIISFLIVSVIFFLFTVFAGPAKIFPVVLAIVSGNPSVTLKINGMENDVVIPMDSSITLSWQSTNAAFCYAYGNWSGDVSQSGSKVFSSVDADKKYYIVCGNHSIRNLAIDSISVSTNLSSPTPSSSPSPLPDLEVLSGHLYNSSGVEVSSLLVGQTGKVVFKLINRYADTNSYFNWKLYLNDVQIVYAGRGRMVANEAFTLEYPWTAVAGTQTFGVDVNSDRHFQESNWANNILAKSFQISSPSPSPTPTPTLLTNIHLSPSSGQAPLTNVSLRADVSGNAIGPVNYKFYCTEKLQPDFIVSAVENESYEATNLCQYETPARYTVKVVAERQGVSAESKTEIIVREPVGTCSSLNYPSDRWQRVWSDGSGSCLGDGPDEMSELFSNSWQYGEVAWGKSDNITFSSSKTIIFSVKSKWRIELNFDDRARLWIDGNLIIDEWGNQGYKYSYKDVDLTVGSHQFRIDYQELDGAALISFKYDPLMHTMDPSYPRGDLNKDGEVDDKDIDVFLADPSNLNADLISDGVVNGFDYWELVRLINESN
ncbi:MAG: PA14 domain-containing protein [bacterium]